MILFNSDILFEIFKYLPNEDIYAIKSISKSYKKMLLLPHIFNHIKYRYHPMVFNYADNLCKKCNIGLYFITGEKFEILRCNHFS